MKEVGILLPVFSLPSKYGIGDFGYEACEFIDILSENGIKYWEILPINATEKFPYSPISYYALNVQYISIDRLINMGLLGKDEVVEFLSSDKVVYDSRKDVYYKKAFERFKKIDCCDLRYLEIKNNKNIVQYAKYMNNKTGEDIEYLIFLQYVLDKQWSEILDYAHFKNVKIIGDMPIYPAFESVEVIYNQKYYQLKNGEMKYVSGVPGDFQYPDGQIWGSPVYDCECLRKDKYQYLIERYKEFLNRYDVIRIDHFIGYDRFYKIPINESADNGLYEDGVGADFFEQLLKIASVDRFIVEDLGMVKDTTIQLKEKYGFIGSNIVPFSIDYENMEDKFYDVENVVSYIGTHDCDTIVGLYESMSMELKMKMIIFLKKNNCREQKINKAWMQYCLNNKSRIVIFMIQDILGLDNKARINMPGKDLAENWSWKLKDFEDLKYYFNNFNMKKMILNNK